MGIVFERGLRTLPFIVLPPAGVVAQETVEDTVGRLALLVVVHAVAKFLLAFLIQGRSHLRSCLPGILIRLVFGTIAIKFILCDFQETVKL